MFPFPAFGRGRGRIPPPGSVNVGMANGAAKEEVVDIHTYVGTMAKITQRGVYLQTLADPGGPFRPWPHPKA